MREAKVEERAKYRTTIDTLLQRDTEYAKINDKPPETIQVSRRELEQEHTHLLGRLQQLRRLLGYQPLPTGKQLRREYSK